MGSSRRNGWTNQFVTRTKSTLKAFDSYQTLFFMRLWIALISITWIFSRCQPLPTPPQEIQFPAAYVINGGENSISVINLHTLQVDRTVFIPNHSDRFAHHIYASPDQKTLAIAMPSHDFSKGHSGLHQQELKGGIVLIDAKTLQMKSSWDIPFTNHNAIFSPDGTEIWTATHTHNGEVLVYDSSTLQLIHRANLGPDPGELVATSTNQVYANLGESSFVARVPVQTKEEAKMIKVDLFPTSVWPGNDTLLIVENKHQKSLNLIDLRTNQAFDALDLTFSPGHTKLIQDELWICEPGSPRVHIYQKQEKGWNAQAILVAQEDAHALAVYKEKVLVVNQQGHSVSVFDFKTKQVIQHIRVGFKPNGVAILP